MRASSDYTRTGGIVLIGGEPGVGKSRLGAEALSIGRSPVIDPIPSFAINRRFVSDSG